MSCCRPNFHRMKHCLLYMFLRRGPWFELYVTCVFFLHYNLFWGSFSYFFDFRSSLEPRSRLSLFLSSLCSGDRDLDLLLCLRRGDVELLLLLSLYFFFSRPLMIVAASIRHVFRWFSTLFHDVVKRKNVLDCNLYSGIYHKYKRTYSRYFMSIII